MGFRGRSDRPQARALLGFVCGAVGLLPQLRRARRAAAVPADSVGIYSEELERADSAYPVSEGRAQRDAGVGIVRQTFSWARIETVPNGVNFAVYDQVMAAAALARRRGAAGDHGSAAVAQHGAGDRRPRRHVSRRATPEAMAVLAGLLVQRYGPGGAFWAAHPELPADPIRSWQIWNEPNTPNFWAPAPDPAAYADLLRTAAAAIRAADPAAEVVTAGLPASDRGVPLETFLDGMYDAGAGGSFDTLAVHPYASDAAARCASCAARVPKPTVAATPAAGSGPRSSAGRRAGRPSRSAHPRPTTRRS